MVRTYSVQIGDREITVEHGKVAKQAQGAVTVRCGDSIVLVTACMSDRESNLDFFPLTVEYREKAYAVGKIPGSIFKREGRPAEGETLSARLIDHQIRPLFPKHLKNEIQVMVSVLSHDQENDPDVLACIGASLALSISKIPFNGPYGAVRVARDEEGNKILLPTYEQREASDCDIVVAGHKESMLNIEGEAHEISEEDMLDMMVFGHEAIQSLCDFQQNIVDEIGVPKVDIPEPVVDEELVAKVEEIALEKVRANLTIADKDERKQGESALTEAVVTALLEGVAEEEQEERTKAVTDHLSAMFKREMRERILNEGARIDGRKIDEVRDITCEIALLPRAHGSALFTRGQTQSLSTITLGTKLDERLVDDLEGKSYKSYMLDYNFPPFSVGEVRRIMGPGRREIGHGALAEHAITPVIPVSESFPYTLRIVSDILESNGSSSMATVCAASLALMDGGVPVKAAVAGVNCGLITSEGRSVILTDLLGIEDANGDMDLKIAGTREGITAFQMDIKIAGIPIEILREAFERARVGRQHVLDIMDTAISEPRPELSRFAPRIISIKIDTSQIGAVIGPGGKNIRELQEATETVIEIDDDGTVNVSSLNGEGGEEAVRRIQAIVKVPEEGEIYEGLVKSVQPYGAFVEILPGKDGLLHISEITLERLERVEDALNVGDKVKVVIVAIDQQGKLKLSAKRLLDGYDASADKGSSDRGDRSRGGDRGRDRGRGRSGGGSRRSR